MDYCFTPNLALSQTVSSFRDAGFQSRISVRLFGPGAKAAIEVYVSITVEAEFLYVLLAKEAAALHEGNTEGVEICREARRKFFQEHAEWWLPAFARLLSRVASTAYYRQLAALTGELSALERVSLGLSPFTARIILRPLLVEAEATCNECISQAGSGS